MKYGISQMGIIFIISLCVFALLANGSYKIIQSETLNRIECRNICDDLNLTYKGISTDIASIFSSETKLVKCFCKEKSLNISGVEVIIG